MEDDKIVNENDVVVNTNELQSTLERQFGVLKEDVKAMITQEVQKNVVEQVRKYTSNFNIGAKDDSLKVNENALGLYIMGKMLAKQQRRDVNACIEELEKNCKEQGIARKSILESVNKGLNASESPGGFLITSEMQPGIMAALQSKSVMRNSGCNVDTTKSGKKTYRKWGAMDAFTYQGENATIPEKDVTLSLLQSNTKKLAGIIVASNTAIRNADINLLQELQQQAIYKMGLAEDNAFLYGAGTVFVPKGLDNWIISANKNAATSPVTVATLKNDLLQALDLVEGADALGASMKWLMHPTVKNFLLAVVTSTGDAVSDFQTVKQGTLYGYPIITSTRITSTDIFFGDFSMSHIHQTPVIYVDESIDYGFPTDETAIRLVTENDFIITQDAAFSKIYNASFTFS